MNTVYIYQVWKSGFKHQIIVLSDGTTLDFRPKDDVRVGHAAQTLKNRKIVSVHSETTRYSDEELIQRAKDLQLTWRYFAPTKNCEDFKNLILHNMKKSETRDSLIIFGLGAMLGLAILRSI